MLSPKLNMQYSTDQLVEYQYAPNGVPSDQYLADNFTSTSSIGCGQQFRPSTASRLTSQADRPRQDVPRAKTIFVQRKCVPAGLLPGGNN